MYTLSIRAKFKFGDRVRFAHDTSCEKITGMGTIFAIMIDKYDQVSYMIDTSVGEYTDTLEPGIFEHEITLVESEKHE